MVITEDSDLLVFGVRKVFFKMDRTGNGFEVDLDRIGEVDEEVDFRTFTHDMFMTCCIISGCDYLDSIKGVGFKKAFRLVYENGNDLKNIVKKIRREGKLLIPPDYEKNFEKAFLTFKFQYVFCPEKRQLIHLNNPKEHTMGELLNTYETKDFLGEQMDSDLVLSIARGHVDPITKQSYEILMKDWQASNKAVAAEEEKNVHTLQKAQS
jgi:exonuclease-1